MVSTTRGLAAALAQPDVSRRSSSKLHQLRDTSTLPQTLISQRAAAIELARDRTLAEAKAYEQHVAEVETILSHA